MSDPNTSPTSHPDYPDFRSREFLLDHALRTMTFYHPHCMDPAGGFYHFYKDDGTIYDRKSRHLCRVRVSFLTMRWLQAFRPR